MSNNFPIYPTVLAIDCKSVLLRHGLKQKPARHSMICKFAEKQKSIVPTYYHACYLIFPFYFVPKQFIHMLTLDSVNVFPSVDVYKSRKKQDSHVSHPASSKLVRQLSRISTFEKGFKRVFHDGRSKIAAVANIKGLCCDMMV